MTVTSSIQDVTYDTDGATVAFPTRFYFTEDNQVFVDKIDDSGTITSLVPGTDYTVSGAGAEAGGTVTTLAVYPRGLQLHIYRLVPVTQETQYQQNDPFPAKSTEKALDKLTMIAQQHGAAIDNSIRYPLSEYGTDGILPPAGDRANTVLGFDPVGNKTLLPIPASVGAGDLRNESWTDGIDYVSGTTTQLPLSRSYGSKANLGSVVMDGVAQDPNSYRLVGPGNVLEFIDDNGNVTPIPFGIGRVWCIGGTTVSLYLPSDGTVRDAAVAPSTALYVRIHNEVSVMDPAFGARIDGITDDSAAFNACAAYCAANGVSMWVPDGHMMIPNAQPITSGRLSIRGNGHGVIVGSVVYNNANFPPSVDGAAALDETAPFFSARNVSFKSVNNNWALTVAAQVQTKFIDTCEIINCRFYGKYGFRGQNLISCSISGSWFYNTLIGAQSEGATNWTITQCWFRQQAQHGFNATVYAANPTRRGGENLRFIGCEFAGCSIGVRLQQTMWTTFDSCLFDYCGLPLYLLGAAYVKLAKSYLGAYLLGSTAAIAGYAAPPTAGVAMYARPYVDGSNVYPSGFSATNCEFVSYLPGATLPTVYADGSVAGQPSQVAIDRASLVQCKVLTSVAHSMQYMAELSYAQIATIDDCEFISPNLSSTLLAPYTMVNCTSFRGSANDSTQCTQSGVQVLPTQEKVVTSTVKMVSDAEGLLIRNASDAVCTQIKGTGNDRVLIFTGGALKLVGSGPADSGGAGYRQLIVPN
ncbi:hypothetical protein KTF22_03130 [Burkholderia multivorans]|uniref:hypothetical protein n=1 Tax=Burkholderia multivorans TaxID=87883 RepID=UPI001C220A9D|nr:hypothetical protein [Burkholderia multivorans]MBU9660886.1 hypothetical protein [Burkholderia multivorans]